MRFPRPVFAHLVLLFATVAMADDSAVYLGAQTAEPLHAPSLLRQWTESPPSLPLTRLPSTDRVAQAPVATEVGTSGQQSPNTGADQGAYGAAVPQQQQPPGYGPASAPVVGTSPQSGHAAPVPGYANPVTPAYAMPPGYGATSNGGFQSNPYGSVYGYQGTNAPSVQVAPPVAAPYETLGSEGVTALPAPSAALGISEPAHEVPAVDPVGIAPPMSPPQGYYPPVSSGGFDNLWGGHGNASGGYESGYVSSGYQAMQPVAAAAPGYVQSYVPTFAPTYGYGGPVAPTSSSGLQFAGSPANCRSICGCDPCSSRAWFRADVMFGWLSGYDTPPLLARNPVGTAIDYVGDVTSPETRVIFGGNNIGDDVRIGGRLFGGYWFDDCRKWGVQADVFGIGNDNEDIDIYSDGDPILSRPFYNTDPAYDAADAQVLALGGVASGQFTASSSSRLFSVAPALRFNICCCGGAAACAPQCYDPCDPCAQGYASGASGCGIGGGGCGFGSCGQGATASRVDLIAGYRFLQLREGFSTREILYPTGPGYTPGTSFTLLDDIDTKNDFHAFELGANWQLQRGRLLWDFGWSAAFGELTRRYTLNGRTQIYAPSGLNETVAGGFLVPPENIGSFESSKFTVMPQARIGLGYCIARNIRLHADYSFLYLDNVFRPGALMADEFDGRFLGAEPADGVVGSANVDYDTEDVMLHALSIGISCNY